MKVLHATLEPMSPSVEEPREQAAGTLRGDHRLKRVLHGGASALVYRGVALLTSLVSLPLTTRYLGPERYGIWVTLSTSVTMLAVLDLGIANSLSNRISQAFARNDDGMAQMYYASAVWMSTAISLLLGVMAFLLWPHLHIPALFHVSDSALARDTSLCVAATLAFFLFGLPLNLSHRVLSGYQETQVVNYFLLVSNLVGLAAILTAIRIHAGLLGLTLTYSGTLLICNVLLNVWLVMHRRRQIFPWPAAMRGHAMRELLQFGTGFFVLQIAGLIVFNSDNLVITHYMGAANVMAYSVTWKLASLAGVLQTAIFPSLWPAYTEAYASGNYDWVRRTFWLAMKSAMGLTATAMLLLLFFGRMLIHWYIGPAAVPAWPLIAAICGWMLLSTCMDLEACLLAALDAVKLQGALSILAACINLALSIYLVQRIGPLGVVLGTIISYAVTLVGPQTVLVWRKLYPSEPLPALLGTEGHVR